MRAPIYGIERLRMKTDGDGVRTLICFQGCPLRCKYCINKGSSIVDENSKYYNVQQLLEEVSIDSLYFQATAGGITFGGGEPLLYPDFMLEFMGVAPKQWNYWIETSLNVPWENVEKVIGKFDKYVVDIKSMNPDIYNRYTEQDNIPVIVNLIKLKNMVGTERIIVRVPYIEGFTSLDDQIESERRIRELGFSNIDCFSYKLPRD